MKMKRLLISLSVLLLLFGFVGSASATLIGTWSFGWDETGYPLAQQNFGPLEAVAITSSGMGPISGLVFDSLPPISVSDQGNEFIITSSTDPWFDGFVASLTNDTNDTLHALIETRYVLPRHAVFEEESLAFSTDPDFFGNDIVALGLYVDEFFVEQPDPSVDRINFRLGFDLNIYDSTSSATPVPEPSTIVLIGLGFIGLAGFGRKKFER